MRILISNDDGYKARGIHALARVMAEFGEVTVVAPKYHQSAMSMAVSLGMKRLAHKALPEEGPGNWHYLDATPQKKSEARRCSSWFSRKLSIWGCRSPRNCQFRVIRRVDSPWQVMARRAS